MSAGKLPLVAGAAATGAGMMEGPTGSIALGSVGSGGGCGEAEGPGLIRVWDGKDKDERWREDEVTPSEVHTDPPLQTPLQPP